MKKSLIYALAILTLLTTVAAAGTFPANNSNMKAYYHFNNQSSFGENTTNVYDHSGNQVNLTVNGGATYNQSAGFLGDGAFNFDGVNDYIAESSGVGSPTNLTKELSLSFWFKVNELSNKRMGLVGRSISTTRLGYGCFLESNAALGCYINNASNGLMTRSTGASSIVANRWYHVTFTFNSTTGLGVIYLDGKLNNSGSQTGEVIGSTGAFSIGRWGSQNQNYTNGTIDEVILENRALTANEVWDRFHAYQGCINLSLNAVNTFPGNSTICPGIYNTNITSAIFITHPGVIIDGNGSVLITGNYSTTSSTDLRAITTNSSYVTIKNLNVTNYYRAFYTSTGNLYGLRFENMKLYNNYFGLVSQSSGAQNWTFTNNTFRDNGYSDLYFSSNAQIGHIIENSSFYNASRYGYEDVEGTIRNMTFRNNIINNTDTGSNGIQVYAEGSLIVNNDFYGDDFLAAEGIRIFGHNLTIQSNRFKWYDYQLYWLGENTTNITVINNNFTDTDLAIYAQFNIRKLRIINNSFDNVTTNLDAYNVAVVVRNTSDIEIRGNNFSRVATTAIVLQGTTNTLIAGNSIDFIPLENRSQYSASDGFEPRCAIQATKRYKGFFTWFGNQNLTITGNNMSSNVPCYLHLENSTQLTHDLTDYWYRSFKPELSFSGLYEFYVPNAYDELTRYHSGTTNYNFRIGDGSLSSSLHLEHNQSKTRMIFRNINATAQKNVTIYNITSGWSVRNASASQLFFTSSGSTDSYLANINTGNTIVVSSCSVNWVCTDYVDYGDDSAVCSGDLENRTCSDTNMCGLTATMPDLYRCLVYTSTGGGGGGSSVDETPVLQPGDPAPAEDQTEESAGFFESAKDKVLSFGPGSAVAAMVGSFLLIISFSAGIFLLIYAIRSRR